MNDKKPPPDQGQKFKDAAREHECDPDEKRWEERLKKVTKAKPEPKGGK
jgi:hypothetical protein